MRLTITAITLCAVGIGLSGCLAATAVGAAAGVAGAAVGVAGAAVKGTVHVGHVAVDAVTPLGDKPKDDKKGG